jgi:predicted nucleic acid-binding protein
MTVISNTTPLNYLILIQHVDLLPQMYGRVLIPQAVHDELQSKDTPERVREWVANHPEWFEVHQVTVPPALLGNPNLHKGELEAIALAIEMQPDAILLDEKAGRAEAARRGLRVIGTLRVLYDAAGLGFCELKMVFDRLRQTNFRASEDLFQTFLDMDANRQAGM